MTNGAAVTQLKPTEKKLLEHQQTGAWTSSKSITKLAAALAKAQGELELAPCNATVPVTERGGVPREVPYADLASIFRTIRPVFARYGLAVSQLFTTDTGDPPRVLVTTILMHESGQRLVANTEVTAEGSQLMKVGAALTLARRYGLMAVAGVAQSDSLDVWPPKGRFAKDDLDQTSPDQAAGIDSQTAFDLLREALGGVASGDERDSWVAEVRRQTGFGRLTVEQREQLDGALKERCEQLGIKPPHHT